jgi:hypothetical protein
MVAITSLIFGLAATTLAAAVPTKSGLASMSHLPLGDMTWSGALVKGGPVMNITGNHHDITNSIKNANPYWLNPNHPHYAEAHAHFMNITTTGHPMSEGAQTAGALQKRSNRVSQACNQRIFLGPQDRDWAYPYDIANGVNYLYAVGGGHATCSVGARTCARVSCSWDSAILFCNDNNFGLSLPCSLIAQNARFVLETCEDPATQSVEGQAFYINPSYNVLVKATDPGKGC